MSCELVMVAASSLTLTNISQGNALTASAGMNSLHKILACLLCTLFFFQMLTSSYGLDRDM